MLDNQLKTLMIVGALSFMSTASPAFSQNFNQQQYYAQLQQSAAQNAAAQDAWAARTVPGMYPGGYNDGTKSYNFDGSITPNGYGLTPSYNGFGQIANPYGNFYGYGQVSGYQAYNTRHRHHNRYR